VLIFFEDASRSPENCLADPSLRTTDLKLFAICRSCENDSETNKTPSRKGP